MGEIPDGVRGALAAARLKIEQAEAKPKKKRSPVYVPENDAFTRSEIGEARG